MDLIQSNGQPHYGRFSELPKTIDLNKYQYKTPYGEVLTGWRKKLKYKNLSFVAFNMNTTPLVLRLLILLGLDMVSFIFMIILKMKCLNGTP
jgi:hypothetical protein